MPEKDEVGWNDAKSASASERALLERAMWEQEPEELVEQTKDQIADGLPVLVQCFDIPLFSRVSGIVLACSMMFSGAILKSIRRRYKSSC